MKIFLRTLLLTIGIFPKFSENASGMGGGGFVLMNTPERRPDKIITHNRIYTIGVWIDHNGNVENLHIIPRNNFRIWKMHELSSYIAEVDKIRFRVYHMDGVIYGALYEPLPSENVSGMHGGGFGLINTPERRPDKIITHNRIYTIGVWIDHNGNVENLHLIPRNNFRIWKIHELSSYIAEADKIRFRVYHKDRVIYGAIYEPLRPAHAAEMHQAGSSRPSSQTDPPQHEFGPPSQTPYHSGYVTYDGAIFEFWQNPVTGKAVDIRPKDVEDNWVPTQDQIEQYQIHVDRANYYHIPFVVYKLPGGKIVGSRLA